jgi:hypothetical protein
MTVRPRLSHRPRLNAELNRVKGGGYEDVAHYSARRQAAAAAGGGGGVGPVELKFYDIENIHKIRESHEHRPGPASAALLSTLSSSHSKSVFYGGFVWECRALNILCRRSPPPPPGSGEHDPPRGGGRGGPRASAGARLCPRTTLLRSRHQPRVRKLSATLQKVFLIEPPLPSLSAALRKASGLIEPGLPGRRAAVGARARVQLVPAPAAHPAGRGGHGAGGVARARSH